VRIDSKARANRSQREPSDRLPPLLNQDDYQNQDDYPKIRNQLIQVSIFLIFGPKTNLNNDNIIYEITDMLDFVVFFSASNMHRKKRWKATLRNICLQLWAL